MRSVLLGRTVEQVVVAPEGNTRRRPLLLLLHGRSSAPDDLDSHELHDALKRLGKKAPIVVLVNGGDHSYYHDRRDGKWGSYVVREVIPTVVRRYHADGHRVAIGGFSMGGFGALDIARLEGSAPWEVTPPPCGTPAARHRPVRTTTRRTSRATM